MAQRIVHARRLCVISSAKCYRLAELLLRDRQEEEAAVVYDRWATTARNAAAVGVFTLAAMPVTVPGLTDGALPQARSAAPDSGLDVAQNQRPEGGVVPAAGHEYDLLPLPDGVAHHGPQCDRAAGAFGGGHALLGALCGERCGGVRRQENAQPDVAVRGWFHDSHSASSCTGCSAGAGAPSTVVHVPARP